MKKKFLSVFLVFNSTLIILCNAQAPAIQWAKCFGGSSVESAAPFWYIGESSIKQTLDRGYILAGTSSSNDGDVSGNHGMNDFWILRLDSIGDTIWQKSFGGSGEDQAYSILQTTDGGYIICGFTNSNDSNVTGNHGNFDYWIVKLDGSGNIIWQKCLGGSDDDEAYNIDQTNDGGYIVAGASWSNDGDVTGHHGATGLGGGPDYWVVKLDSIGTITWQKSIGGTAGDVAYYIKQCTDGGYIVAGESLSNDSDVSGNHGIYDFWIVKLNATGTIFWQKSLGGSSDDQSFTVQETIDGGYIATGHSESNNGDVSGNHGYQDYWVVKLDSSGFIQWQKCLGGSMNDFGTSIHQVLDKGYIIAGHSFSNNGNVSGNHGNADYWIVKLDSLGVILWQKSLGGSNDDEAYYIAQTFDGGYIISGATNSNNGDVSGNHGDYDYWIVKLAPDTVTGMVARSEGQIAELCVFPNPASQEITVSSKKFGESSTIKVFDVFGEEIISQKITTPNCKLKTANLKQGIYFIKAGNAVTKFVKE